MGISGLLGPFLGRRGPRGWFLRDFAGFSLIFDFLRARGAEIEVSIGISEAPRAVFHCFSTF